MTIFKILSSMLLKFRKNISKNGIKNNDLFKHIIENKELLWQKMLILVEIRNIDIGV